MFSANCRIEGSLSYISLVSSALNLSTNEEAVDLIMKFVGALTRDHQYSTVSSIHVYHRQHSCLGMCLGTPTATPEMKLKIHLHARYLAIELDSCVPIAFPSGLNTDFAPRSSWQVSQVAHLNHCSARWIVRSLQWNCSRCLSVQLPHPGLPRVLYSTSSC